MLGFGLGGFAQGFERGVGLGDRMYKQQRQRAQDKTIDQATTEGQAAHTKAVAAGTAKPGDPADIMRHVLPRMVAPLLKAGNFKAAEEIRGWAESDATRRATQLFGQGMIAGQAGDMRTAIGKFVEAGRTRGYGGNYTISDPEQIDGGGMRVRIAGPDGREFVQEFRTADEVLRFGSTWLNPEAAFQQWQASRADQAKRAADINQSLTIEQGKAQIGLGRRREEKAIDTEDAMNRQRAGVHNMAQYLKARERAVKELEVAGQLGPLAHQKPTPEQAERMIERRTQEILGGAGRTGAAKPPQAPGVLVDTKTGRQMDAPAAAPAAGPEGTPPAVATPAAAPAAAPAVPATPQPTAAQRGFTLLRDMVRRQPVQATPTPAAAAPAPAAPAARLPRREQRQVDQAEEYKRLQQELSRLPANSEQARAMRQRMLEIEQEIRATS